MEREGAVGIEMLKFEQKREILQKFGKNLGGLQPPGSAPHACRQQGGLAKNGIQEGY